ncbi:MAG: helix-turn-helix transcriptional regulator [Planctomycetes bacterium]|nr:helix-turn-helix transcriptional regulator [Planctomycetota bacterium]
MTDAVHVVAQPERAMSLLDPVRQRILEALAEPTSAVELATRLGVPRQRLNYHLQELLRHGLLSVVHEHERGSVRERVYQRVGGSYAISREAIGALGSRPELVPDRFSSAYQIAVASQAIADLAQLREGAAAAGQVLPTLSLEVDVRFASASARSAFAQELADAVATLVEKHHDARARGGRTFKFYVGGYPRPAAD